MTKEPEVLNNTEIKPTVELQLTKTDLVDMVVAEQEEAVEQELDAIDAKIKEAEEMKKAAKEEHEKAMTTQLKARFGKRIKAAEKFLKGKASVVVGASHRIHPLEYYDYQVYNSKRRKTMKTITLPQVLPARSVCAGIGTSKTEHPYESGKWEVKLKLDDSELELMSTAQRLKEINEKHVNLVKQRCEAESKLSNIETMGQRAKARMVRQVLSGSAQGRQLLQNIPKLDSSRLLKAAKPVAGKKAKKKTKKKVKKSA